jgi:hypothetical protein
MIIGTTRSERQVRSSFEWSLRPQSSSKYLELPLPLYLTPVHPFCSHCGPASKPSPTRRFESSRSARPGFRSGSAQTANPSGALPRRRPKGKPTQRHQIRCHSSAALFYLRTMATRLRRAGRQREEFVSGSRPQIFMFHLGEARHELTRDGQIVHHDCEVSLSQVCPSGSCAAVADGDHVAKGMDLYPVNRWIGGGS